MKFALVFLRRDWRIATSRRVPFLIEGLGILFALLEVAFVGRIVRPGAVSGGYFPFVLTGLVLTGLLAAGIVTMAGFVRQEQVQGTLEVLVSTGTPVGRLVTGLATYPFAAAIARSAFLLGIAAVIGTGVSGNANWLLALVGLAIASISFVGLGVLASALVLTFRYGAGAMGWLLTILVFGAGVVFPIGLFPAWAQTVSSLSPLTESLKVVRAALLEGASWSSQASSLLALVAAGVFLSAVGWMAARWAVRRAVRLGTLAQY